MRVCLGPSLPGTGVCLQLAGAGSTEWQSPERKTYVSRRRGVTTTGDAGSFEIWLGSRDIGFGEDGCFYAGMEMGQLDRESLVKDNL